jgi:hypothetical protein
MYTDSTAFKLKGFPIIEKKSFRLIIVENQWRSFLSILAV